MCLIETANNIALCIDMCLIVMCFTGACLIDMSINTALYLPTEVECVYTVALWSGEIASFMIW